MSFQHKLDGLFNKGKAKYEEYTNKHSNQAPQQNYQYQQPYPNQNQYPPPQQHQYGPPAVPQRPGPPPINYSSKPGSYTSNPSGPAPPREYWRAQFHPQTPIWQLFQQETGAHGWGNNESQNYTTDAANSFFTADNKLVLRGIVNSHAPAGSKYTSARLVSAQALSRQRGCLTAVLTAPSARGIWPAFWLLPDACNWPTDGEVDVFESWNGDDVNHSCLHWGHYNGEDWDKHRVVDTPIPGMARQAHVFAFAWDQPDEGRQEGRLVWYIDGRAVMKASIPAGTRPMRDYKIILNVAMGGNVCQGKLPVDGIYDFVVHELKMCEEPIGGWGQFGADWDRTREGKTM